MAVNYVQPGDRITVTAPAALSSGEPVKIGGLFGVAQTDAASGAQVAIATEGVWSLAKVSTDVFAVGAPVYFDATAKLCTDDGDDGDNLFIGLAVTSAANPSATVSVKLCGPVDLLGYTLPA